MPRDGKPVAFLCHASEDKDVVRRLAYDFVARGIDVFFDEWEIRAGDSLRQKIDAGLERCTHFIAFLSPNSIEKPWVNSEIDAGFVKRLGQDVVFIPLRLGLDVTELPPLLRGMSAPSLDDYDRDLPKLISDIHKLTLRPPLGPNPPTRDAATPGSSLSPAAEAIVRLFVERSVHGDTHDPQLEVGEVREATGLTDDDIVDGLDELERAGYAGKHAQLGCGPIGFDAVYPTGKLFAGFDSQFRHWDPAKDALILATRLEETAGSFLEVAKEAVALGWPPRRMNPAIHYLLNRQLVTARKALGTLPWAALSIEGTPQSRRFARQDGK